MFPPDRVRVVVHDDFRRDNVATFAEVVSFLGLDAAFRPEVRKENENRSARFPFLSTAVAWSGDLEIKNLVPERARRRLRRMLRNLNLKPATRTPLDPEFRRELMARFRPEVEALSRVLERDLVSLWGYDASAQPIGSGGTYPER